MVFTSIALAMCHISDTKKLGRISYKTILGFAVTTGFAIFVFLAARINPISFVKKISKVALFGFSTFRKYCYNKHY